MLPPVPNPVFCSFCENRHPALSFAQSKSFYSTYFKCWLFLEQSFGFTEPTFCVDRSKITVGVHDMMGLIFLGSPWKLYEIGIKVMCATIRPNCRVLIKILHIYVLLNIYDALIKFLSSKLSFESSLPWKRHFSTKFDRFVCGKCRFQ